MAALAQQLEAERADMAALAVRAEMAERAATAALAVKSKVKEEEHTDDTVTVERAFVAAHQDQEEVMQDLPSTSVHDSRARHTDDGMRPIWEEVLTHEEFDYYE